MRLSNIARQRLRNERLIGVSFSEPAEVVQSLGAVQAQDYAGAKWAIGQRVKNCVDADVVRAYSSGVILRTHVMRPTWHFVMPADIRWMLELTAPRVRALMAYYDRKLELDAATFKRTNTAITKALGRGQHLTRSELGRALADAGIEAAGQRLGHIVMRAELGALICSGALRGKQHTYALLEERAPVAKPLPREEALGELTRRYFTSHGPALTQDFAWWSGLTVANAKAGIEMVTADLVSADVDGKTYWSAPSAATPRLKVPTVHLLPNYDEYLIAYKDHSASFAGGEPDRSAALYDMLARHIVVLNGNVIGGWRNVPEKRAVTIETQLLVKLNDAQAMALRAAADRYGRFLGVDARIEDK